MQEKLIWDIARMEVGWRAEASVRTGGHGGGDESQYAIKMHESTSARDTAMVSPRVLVALIAPTGCRPALQTAQSFERVEERPVEIASAENCCCSSRTKREAPLFSPDRHRLKLDGCKSSELSHISLR
jgi:hypothetical protein